MIYLLEIYYRSIYLLLSLLLAGLVFYYNKEIFIFFLALPTQLNFLNNFIFINPKEIFFLFFFTFIFFIILVYIPFVIYILFDFLIPALEKKEFKKIKKYINNFTFIFIFCISTSYSIGLPVFWKFFNNLKESSIYFSFFFEIGGLHYLYYFVSIFNVLILLQLFFYCYFILIKNNIIFVLQYKKYIYTCLILFCTIITPPDLSWQIILFVILCICFEFSFFLYFFLHENKKFLKRQPIKNY